MISSISNLCFDTGSPLLHPWLVRFLSIRRGPTSATEVSVQLDLMSGTVCQQTSNSWTCHTAASDSLFLRHFHLVSGNKMQCESPSTTLYKCCYLMVRSGCCERWSAAGVRFGWDI